MTVLAGESKLYMDMCGRVGNAAWLAPVGEAS
jgi:hypothetical protein